MEMLGWGLAKDSWEDKLELHTAPLTTPQGATVTKMAVLMEKLSSVGWSGPVNQFTCPQSADWTGSHVHSTRRVFRTRRCWDQRVSTCRRKGDPQPTPGTKIDLGQTAGPNGRDEARELLQETRGEP